MVPGYEMNTSCIKVIKFTYNTCKGTKTIQKKRMSEYLEAGKEASTYKATQKLERSVETAEERSARESRQAVAKRAQLSSSENGLSRKKVVWGRSSFTGNF